MAREDDDYVARLRIALARIARGLDRQSRGHVLTRTQVSVLSTAARRGPLRLTDLAEIEGVNPTMLSRVVGKLEDAGLLVRQADPKDRRAALVEPTAEGRALQQRLRDERTRLLAEHLAALPAQHAAELLTALPAIEALAAALVPTEAPGLPPPDPALPGPALPDLPLPDPALPDSAQPDSPRADSRQAPPQKGTV